MPRGTKDGSIVNVPAVIDEATGQVIRRAHMLVKKRYTDLKGRPREKKRIAYTETEAARRRREIDREIEQDFAGVERPNPRRSFSDLVAYYKLHEMKPAEYIGEMKIAGLRSFAKFQSRLKPLEKFFGRMSLVTITYGDVADYKRQRLLKPTVHGRQRSIAAVNRELSLLRHLFFLALRERWIAEHPFHRGKPLIQTADEVKRMRVLTWDEEERLLAVCVGPRRHLRLEILFALETALRQGEQMGLELRDVDARERVISLRAFSSKTAQIRVVPIFDRLARELAPALRDRLVLLKTRPNDPRLFLNRNPRRAFHTACRLAGIEGLRWHDLRHTAITRMLHFYKLSEAEVMKISGHTSYKTFLRYVNIDREIARSIAARVDAIRAASLPDLPSPSPDVTAVTAESESVN